MKINLKHELTVFLGYFLFLAFFISVFTLYKQLILKQYDLSTFQYSYGLIEALILAKIIMIGQAFKLGERFSDRSLIIPTLYKTLIFSLFVLLFNILEKFVVGYFAGNSMSAIFQKLLNEGIYDVLAKVLLMAFVFVFFFAFLELGRVLGETKDFFRNLSPQDLTERGKARSKRSGPNEEFPMAIAMGDEEDRSGIAAVGQIPGESFERSLLFHLFFRREKPLSK